MRRRSAYRPYGGKRAHPILWALAGLIAAGLVCFAVLAGIVAAGERTDIRGTPQVMIVLGCKVEADGPSELLRDRLDTALDYLDSLPERIPVIVSGGQGKDEPESEAACMAEYLAQAGYSGDIYLEDNSHSTAENLGYSLDILDQLGLDAGEDRVLIVSNGFHLSRARMLAERFGYGDVSTLAAPSSHAPSRVSMFFREPLALVKSFLLDRTTPQAGDVRAEAPYLPYGG